MPLYLAQSLKGDKKKTIIYQTQNLKLEAQKTNYDCLFRLQKVDHGHTFVAWFLPHQNDQGFFEAFIPLIHRVPSLNLINFHGLPIGSWIKVRFRAKCLTFAPIDWKEENFDSLDSARIWLDKLKGSQQKITCVDGHPNWWQEQY